MKELGKARSLTLVVALGLIATACTGGASPSPSTATQAPASSAAASESASAEPSESAAASGSAEASGSATAGGDGEYTIGFSNAFGIGNGFREEQLCTAKAQATKSGEVTEATWLHQDDATYPQLQQFNDLIAAQPDAIIFNPNSPDGLNQAIDQAQEAGITTIAIDAYVTDPETYNLSNDQFNYGYVGASWLFDKVGEGNVYYMRGIVGHPADLDRHEGVMKALEEHPGIKLLPSNDGVGTDWSPDKGTQLMNDLITSGGYDDVDGIWTSGIDQQVVDAIKAAQRDFVPIVGADLKGFVEQLLNVSGDYEGLEGIAVYNPAAVGGAGVKLALDVLNGNEPETTTVTRTDSEGNEVDISAVFLPVPEAYANDTEEGKAKLEEINVEGLNNLWPVSWYIDGWTDYSFDEMIACKGPGE
jgi:ribose transport system substrate-binding protein